MNLNNLALSGMNAAQSRITTTGHNISNAATDGYSRQSVQVSTAGASSSGIGFLGRGVQVDTVSRAYNSFLSNQLIQSQSRGAGLQAYANQISQINDLFADRTSGISPALQRFFDGIQTMASTPADPAARQEVIGRANTLVTQINSVKDFVDARYNDVNMQINNAVSQVNDYVARINSLNSEIYTAQAASGHAPNDLLDQRDQILTKLNGLINVKVIEQNGNYNLSIGNGQVLLSDTTQYPLTVIESKDDPQRNVLASTLKGSQGQDIEVPLSERTITGGSLSGLLAFRREVLDSVQNDLGRIAAGITLAFNEIHNEGLDMVGAPAGDFFSIGQPSLIEHSSNSGLLAIDAQFELDGANRLSTDSFEIRFDGSMYQITNQRTGQSVYAGPTLDGVSVDGVVLNTNGATPIAGDSWTLSPMKDIASSFSLAITDPSRIAAADLSGGSANGENALRLAQMQNDKILGGGTMSLNEAFSQLINKVGLQTQQNQNQLAAQNALINQNLAAHQALSGVNLNEEYINLNKFAEQFQASARLLDVSATLFDTLIGIRG